MSVDDEARAAGQNDKTAAARLLRSLQPSARREFGIAVAISFVAALLTIAQAFLVASIIVDIVVNRAGLQDQVSRVVVLVAIFIGRGVAIWSAERFALAAARQAQTRLRTDLLAQLRNLGPVGLSGRPTGQTVSAISDGLRAIEPFYARFVPASMLALIVPLSVLIAVAPFDWISALTFVVTAPMIPLFMVLIGAGAERQNQRQWRTLTRLSGRLLDAIQGLTTLKLFNATQREIETVASLSERYRHETMSILRVAFLSSLALEFFATISIAIVAVVVGFRLLWGDLPLFNGVFVLLLAPEFYLPLRTLGAAYHARMEAIGAAEELAKLMALQPPANLASGIARIGDRGPGVIRLERIAVAFADGRMALDGVDLELKRGERLAVTGPSGGGKSTLLALLMGFLSPSGGRILVDGQPMETLDLDAWRRHIAYLPQRPHLFEGSVSANIAMSFVAGSPIDMARVEAAAVQARFDEIAAALPQGYETLVGERGYGLSGGETQRLALSRAFHRKAPLFLIDEPTAHLDPDTEDAVAGAIEDGVRGSTAVIVTHRRRSLRWVDRIVVIEAGRIVRAGPPHEILSGEHDGLPTRAARDFTAPTGSGG